jgi:hypothetical protein
MQSAPDSTVDDFRLLDRLARVLDFNCSECAIALAQVALGAVQDAAALRAGHRRPDGESRLRRGDCLLDFSGAGLLDAAEHLARRGIEVVEGFAGRRRHVAPADVAVLNRNGGHGDSGECGGRATRCETSHFTNSRASRMEWSMPRARIDSKVAIDKLVANAHELQALCPARTGRPARRAAALGSPARTVQRRRYGFLTLPNYSMIALTSAVEPLRMANRLCRDEIYTWSIVSMDGTPVPASNGLSFSPTVALPAMGPVDVLFVCGGVDVQHAVTKDL